MTDTRSSEYAVAYEGLDVKRSGFYAEILQWGNRISFEIILQEEIEFDEGTDVVRYTAEIPERDLVRVLLTGQDGACSFSYPYPLSRQVVGQLVRHIHGEGLTAVEWSLLVPVLQYLSPILGSGETAGSWDSDRWLYGPAARYLWD